MPFLKSVRSLFAKAPSDSIRLKLSAAFMAVALVIAGFVVGAYRMELQTVERAVAMEAAHLAATVAYSGADNAFSTPEYLQSYADREHALSGRDIVFVDVKQKGIADSNKGEIGDIFNHDPGDEVGLAIRDGRVRTFVERNEQHPQGLKQIVVPLRAILGRPDSLIVGAAIFEYSHIYDGLLATEQKYLYRLGALGIICVLLTMIFGLQIAKKLAERLKSLQDAADVIADGNYETKVAITSVDEVGRLGRAFNTMAGALKSSRDQLEERVASRTEDLSRVNQQLRVEADERAKGEIKIKRLNRVYAVLSQINALIVRVKERDELFDGACRIAVEAGRFRMCWLGLVDREAMKIVPVASAGSTPEHMTFIRNEISLAVDTPQGDNLVARAISGGKALYCNDTQNDPGYRFRKEHARKGTRSVIALPLLVANEAVGVLALYADEIGFFDEAELKLLTELAGDISFAIDHIEKGKKLGRLTRVQAVLSSINALIVRVRDRDELLTEACRVSVEVGGFTLAWIGIVDREAGVLIPSAWEGPGREHIDKLRLGIGDAASEVHLPAEALRAKRPVISNNVAQDPRVILKDEMAARGMGSLAVLPLIVNEAALGTLTLVAAEVGFFDEDEMKLLIELAGDISFALDHIGQAEKLDYLAYYDELTGLANRSLFLERVAQFMRSAARSGHKLALFLFDLERFKNINDSLGRPAGDALLKLVAEWLTRNLGDANLFARIDADHFAIVLPEVKQGGDVARLVEKSIKALLDHPFRLDDAVLRIAAKAGVALYPDDGAEADTLFRNAEAALKNAKASGDRYRFYEQKMTDHVAGKLTLENQLREALDNGEFVLHYQPKVNLESGKLASAEALIRWNDPRTGLVPPGRFIPVLEETGLIQDVGRWALRQAVADYLRWLKAGLPAVRIAVNVSPLQLRDRGFIAEVQQAIGIDPQAAAGLELEITESLIMEDIKHSIASLQKIRAMGVTIAIDDFGTGFSSLSYLAKLPADALKIDRSFVIDMTSGPEGLALVSTIINLAQSLKLKVVAEGVETREQSNLLRLLRCDEMQGFLFSKAVPGDIFETRFLVPAPRQLAEVV